MSLQTVRLLPSTTWPIAQANGCSTSHQNKRAGSLAWRPADSGSDLCPKTFGYLLSPQDVQHQLTRNVISSSTISPDSQIVLEQLDLWALYQSLFGWIAAQIPVQPHK